MNPAGIAFGLITAISWGSADFLGGRASRLASPLATVVASQGLALLISIAALILSHEQVPAIAALVWAGLAGCGASLALAALYVAFATGTMGPAASVAAVVGAGLPVTVGALTGNQVTLPAGIGILAALAAIVLVSLPTQRGVQSRRGIGFSILSGLGAGGFFIAMGQSAGATSDTWWPIVASHGTCFGLAAIVLFATHAPRAIARSIWPVLVLIAITDVLGVLFLLLADRQGAVGIAAVVASQHPAATAILAWIIARERLARLQVAGVVLALAAMSLLASP